MARAKSIVDSDVGLGLKWFDILDSDDRKSKFHRGCSAPAGTAPDEADAQLDTVTGRMKLVFGKSDPRFGQDSLGLPARILARLPRSLAASGTVVAVEAWGAATELVYFDNENAES